MGHNDSSSKARLRVLELLIERGGDIVTRDELKKQLWPDDACVDCNENLAMLSRCSSISFALR